MTYPSQDDVLTADPLRRWLDVHFLRRDPYAFRDKGFDDVVAVCTERLDVDPNGIYIVGSGAIGLSLNPGKIRNGKMKAFGPDSDMDLAVISEFHFEQAWRDLRRAAEPSLEPMSETLRTNLTHQKKRFFDGAILATKLLPELSFGPEWTAGVVRVEEQVARLLDREIAVNMWVYRDYWSLRTYVAGSVMRCRGVAS